VFVNGHEVGKFSGWQDTGQDAFSQDISEHLVAGKNVIAIHCFKYRNRGELPLEASLEPKVAADSYYRALDIADAVSTVRFTLDGVTYTREAFASAPDQVMVFRFSADQPGKISFRTRLERMERSTTKAVGTDALLMSGHTRAHGDLCLALPHGRSRGGVPVGAKLLLGESGDLQWRFAVVGL